MPFIKLIFFYILLLISLTSLAADEVLPPEQVFKVTATAVSTELVEINFTITEGYYLYAKKIRFDTKATDLKLGAFVLPDGEIKHDKFLGEQLIFRNTLTVALPFTANGAAAFQLSVHYQGCSDLGICYPPQTSVFELVLPVATVASPGNPLAQLLKASSKSKAKNDLLPPDQAFQFFATVKNANTLHVNWHIAEAYYLYGNKINFELINAQGVTLGDYDIPEGTPKLDETFGTVDVFYHELGFDLPILRSGENAQKITLKASYQGCAERGVCYPPMSSSIDLELPVATQAIPLAGIKKAPPKLSEQDQIVSSLKQDSLGVTLLSFFGFGLLLSLTPCVFPMIPILSGIIVGHGNHITTLRAFLLSLSYVLASASTYTVFGILAAVFGSNLQAVFQEPWVIALFSAVFVLLSLSMFGFYHLELPNFIKTRLHNSSVRHQDGSIWGAAIMGALSSLIVGPCVAAPLAGALIYIGQTGDALLGGGALFFLGLGMGVPLLLLGASAGKLLPKAGNWLNATQAVFGVIMLWVAVWMLSRILPPAITLLLCAMLLIIPAVYLRAIEPLSANSTGWQKLWKGVGLMMLFYGFLLLIGFSMGNSNPLKPLSGFAQKQSKPTAEGLIFESVSGVAELDSKLQQAKAQHRPVMLDFYADWCVSCKEMEAYTFADAKVNQALAGFMLLRADVTQNSEKDKALLERFKLIGPPAVLFFDDQQQEITAQRVIGYQDVESFLQTISQVKP